MQSILYLFLLTLLGDVFLSRSSSNGRAHSTVQVLTPENFDELLQDAANSFWFLKFYAPWCGHCKKLEPVLDQIAPKIRGKMAIGKMDCTQHNKFCKSHKVKGFPTLKFFRDGEFHDYPGERSAEGIMDFANKMSTNAVASLSSVKDAYDLSERNKDGVAFIAYDEKASGSTIDDLLDSTPFLQMFRQVARKRQAYDTFGMLEPAVSKKEIEELDVGPNTAQFIVRIEKGVDSKPFRGKFFANEVLSFVTSNNIGLITFLGSHNFKSMGNKGKPLAIALLDPSDEEETLQFLAKFKDLARNGPPKITSKYNFCWMDGIKWSRFVQQFNITKEDIPELFILDVPSKIFWRDTFRLQKTELKFFFMAIERGKILPQQQPGSSSNKLVEVVIELINKIVDFLEDNIYTIILNLLVVIPIFYLCYLMLKKVENMPDVAAMEKAKESDSSSPEEKKIESKKEK